MMKQVYWQFLDEVNGAKEYIECASKHREKNRDMSNMYMDMAKTEIEHAEYFLDAMKKIANDEKNDENEGYASAADILVDVMHGQLVKVRAMAMAFE